MTLLAGSETSPRYGTLPLNDDIIRTLEEQFDGALPPESVTLDPTFDGETVEDRLRIFERPGEDGEGVSCLESTIADQVNKTPLHRVGRHYMAKHGLHRNSQAIPSSELVAQYKANYPTALAEKSVTELIATTTEPKVEVAPQLIATTPESLLTTKKPPKQLLLNKYTEILQDDRGQFYGIVENHHSKKRKRYIGQDELLQAYEHMPLSKAEVQARRAQERAKSAVLARGAVEPAAVLDTNAIAAMAEKADLGTLLNPQDGTLILGQYERIEAERARDGSIIRLVGINSLDEAIPVTLQDVLDLLGEEVGDVNELSDLLPDEGQVVTENEDNAEAIVDEPEGIMDALEALEPKRVRVFAARIMERLFGKSETRRRRNTVRAIGAVAVTTVAVPLLVSTVSSVVHAEHGSSKVQATIIYNATHAQPAMPDSEKRGSGSTISGVDGFAPAPNSGKPPVIKKVHPKHILADHPKTPVGKMVTVQLGDSYWSLEVAAHPQFSMPNSTYISKINNLKNLALRVDNRTSEQAAELPVGTHITVV